MARNPLSRGYPISKLETLAGGYIHVPEPEQCISGKEHPLLRPRSVYMGRYKAIELAQDICLSLHSLEKTLTAVCLYIERSANDFYTNAELCDLRDKMVAFIVEYASDYERDLLKLAKSISKHMGGHAVINTETDRCTFGPHDTNDLAQIFAQSNHLVECMNDLVLRHSLTQRYKI